LVSQQDLSALWWATFQDLITTTVRSTIDRGQPPSHHDLLNLQDSLMFLRVDVVFQDLSHTIFYELTVLPIPKDPMQGHSAIGPTMYRDDRETFKSTRK
jgi:hypothetical protein